MAKRVARSASRKPRPQTDTESVKALEKNVIAFAEQLGRIAGAAQAKTDNWLSQPNVSAQLASIRDRAAKLLERVASLAALHDDGAKSPKVSAPRSGGKVDAPGKKHRKAPVAARGVKHSEQKISKALAADRMKRGRARQG